MESPHRRPVSDHIITLAVKARAEGAVERRPERTHVRGLSLKDLFECRLELRQFVEGGPASDNERKSGPDPPSPP